LILGCAAFIATEKGMQAAPMSESAGAAAFAAVCFGGAYGRDLDDSFRVFAGTATKLYELSGSSWTDITRVCGGDYTLGADSYWRFAQFGNTMLAVAKTDTLQASGAGAFAVVSGAP